MKGFVSATLKSSSLITFVHFSGFLKRERCETFNKTSKLFGIFYAKKNSSVRKFAVFKLKRRKFCRWNASRCEKCEEKLDKSCMPSGEVAETWNEVFDFERRTKDAIASAPARPLGWKVETPAASAADRDLLHEIISRRNFWIVSKCQVFQDDSFKFMSEKLSKPQKASRRGSRLNSQWAKSWSWFGAGLNGINKLSPRFVHSFCFPQSVINRVLRQNHVLIMHSRFTSLRGFPRNKIFLASLASKLVDNFRSSS